MVQFLMASIMSAGTKVLGAMFGEKVIIAVFIALGDKLVDSAKNDVTKDIWKPIKEALEQIK